MRKWKATNIPFFQQFGSFTECFCDASKQITTKYMGITPK